MKPTLTLQPAIHRQKDVLLLHVGDYKSLVEVSIAQASARWSATTKSLDVKNYTFNHEAIFKALTPNAFCE